MIRRQRIQPRERVQDRARRRQQFVELAQDGRALDVRAQLVLPRRLRRHGCEDPHDAQTERRAERRAEQAVEQAQAREEEGTAQLEPQALQPAGEDPAGEQRTEQPEGRGVGRGRSAWKQKRTQTSSEECTKREPAEGEHPDDEAPPEAKTGQDGRKRDDDPVELCHLPCSIAPCLRTRLGACGAHAPWRPWRAWPSRSARSSARNTAARRLHPRRRDSSRLGHEAITRAMYRTSTPPPGARAPPSEFAGAYGQALRTATATRTGGRSAEPSDAPEGMVSVPVRVDTRLFGTLSLDFAADDRQRRRRTAPRIAWSRSLAVPRPASRRDAQPTDDASQAGGAARSGRFRARRRLGYGSRNPQLAAGGIGGRRHRRSRPDPDRTPPGARSAGRAFRCDRRVNGAGACPRRAPARDSRRRAARGPASARDRRISCGERRSHHRLSRGTARRRDRARGTARRDRRDGALHRTDPCCRRDRPR